MNGIQITINYLLLFKIIMEVVEPEMVFYQPHPQIGSKSYTINPDPLRPKPLTQKPSQSTCWTMLLMVTALVNSETHSRSPARTSPSQSASTVTLSNRLPKNKLRNTSPNTIWKSMTLPKKLLRLNQVTKTMMMTFRNLTTK